MEPDRISSELKTALAEERLVSETHLSDLETLKTEYLCLQQAHNKLKTDNEGLKSRMGHLQQTAREALGRGEFEKGTLLEQIQALRANQLTPERVEMLKADIAEGIEGITQEKVDRMTIESDRLRQELGKIRLSLAVCIVTDLTIRDICCHISTIVGIGMCSITRNLFEIFYLNRLTPILDKIM